MEQPKDLTLDHGHKIGNVLTVLACLCFVAAFVMWTVTLWL